MRLIDADLLKIKILKERDKISLTRTERYSFGAKIPNSHEMSMRGGIRKALRCMEETPTVDAVPVKHGRWIPLGQYNSMPLVKNYKCSLCGEWVHDGFNYCPNCGAKMDEEV